MSDAASAPPDPAVCPDGSTPLTGVEHGGGQVDKWTSWRITTILRCADLFSSYDAVVAYETSVKGVKHLHAITIGPRSAALVKAIQRKFKGEGKNTYWSKSYSSDDEGKTFEKGVAYTIKDGDYVCFGSINEAWCHALPPWVSPEGRHVDVAVSSAVKKRRVTDAPKAEDLAPRDWQLTYSNLVPQAVKFAKDRSELFVAGRKYRLIEVVKKMHMLTRWRISKPIQRGGVSEYDETRFDYAMGYFADNVDKIDWSWWYNGRER